MVPTNFYHQKNCLPFIFRSELKHIFARLSSHTLLPHCKREMTQNQNKSLNSTVWAQCPKRVFCGINRLKLSVCDAICTFNSGDQSRRHLVDNIGLLSSRNMFYGLEKENRKRILDADREVLEKYKQRWRFLCSQKKKKKVISEVIS